MDIPLNYFAILVAAIVNMVIGSLWYGPVFGKAWMSMTGLTYDSMKGMAMKPWQAMSLGFIAALVMNYMLAHSLVFTSAYTQTAGASAGLMTGFCAWLGFVAPVTLGVVLWEGKPWKLWILNAGYYLVVLLAAGFVLGSWQ